MCPEWIGSDWVDQMSAADPLYQVISPGRVEEASESKDATAVTRKTTTAVSLASSKAPATG